VRRHGTLPFRGFLRHRDSQLDARFIRHLDWPRIRAVSSRATVAATVLGPHEEFDALAVDCVRYHGPRPRAGQRTFNAETGMIHMQRAFARVELREWTGELALPDVNSAVATTQLGPARPVGRRTWHAHHKFVVVLRNSAPRPQWRITHDGPSSQSLDAIMFLRQPEAAGNSPI
jgi:hypothetical protein